MEQVGIFILQSIYYVILTALGVILAFIIMVVSFISFDTLRQGYFKMRYLGKSEGNIFFIYGKDKKAFIEKKMIPKMNPNIILCNMQRDLLLKEFRSFPRGFIEYLHHEADETVNFRRKNQSPYLCIIKEGKVHTISFRSYVFNEKYKNDPSRILEVMNNFIGNKLGK